MHFNGDVSLGSILSVISFLVAAIVAWRDLNWRIKNLEEWKDIHYHSFAEVQANVALLREISSRLEQIAKGQERRLQMLEDRPEYRGRTH